MIVLVDDRIRELAKQPYIRPGAVDMDVAYAVEVFDARCRVDLETLANAHPGEAVSTAFMGFVPLEFKSP